MFLIQAMKNWSNVTYMHENFGKSRGIVDRRKTWKKGGLEVVPRSIMNYRFINFMKSWV